MTFQTTLSFAVFAVALITGTSGEDGHMGHGFYQYSAVDFTGKEVEMREFAERVVLVVNVASECGYTDSNYKWISTLLSRYGERGLSVLLFPCNQFGQQEPGSMSEIMSFIGQQNVDKAKVFQKVSVKGDDADPLFDFLHDRTGHMPTWNFAKYLIDPTGDHVRFYDTRDDLEEVEDMIRHLLHMHTNFTDL